MTTSPPVQPCFFCANAPNARLTSNRSRRTVAKRQRPLAAGDTASPLPFPSPLIRERRKVAAYRKRYPMSDFIDVAAVVRAGRAGHDPLAHIRDYLYTRYEDRGCPLVLLFPLAELLAGGEWIDRLLRYAFLAHGRHPRPQRERPWERPPEAGTPTGTPTRSGNAHGIARPPARPPTHSPAHALARPPTHPPTRSPAYPSVRPLALLPARPQQDR